MSLGKQPSAFVLDDHHVTAEIISRMLVACGLAATPFSNVENCLQSLQVPTISRPEVIVLDLALGQSDAIDVIRVLERLKYKGKVVLISSSEQATLHDVTEIGAAHGLAMLPALQKPFRIEQLKASLQAPPLLAGNDSAGAEAKPQRVDLFNALASGWLELWYQPKFDIKSMVIRSVESLVRMRHPKFGILWPAEFLPAAGDPVYFPLSRLVVKTALADWSAHFADLTLPPKLAVNIPLSVIVGPGFVDLLRGLLPSSSRFPGLIIEVTEGDVVRNTRQAREIATQLKLYNIWLSVDDFGAAYSTFSRIRDLPVVEVKIDGSFVTGCSADAAKQALCLSVIELAHRFSATACAEGVDNQDDLQTLADMGCDTAQGFLLAKPQPAIGLKAGLVGSAELEAASA